MLTRALFTAKTLSKGSALTPLTRSLFTSRKVQSVDPHSLVETKTRNEITQKDMLVPASSMKPLADSFAVVSVGGKQFKVTKGDEIMVDKMEGAPLMAKILLDKVLLVGTKEFTVIGQPLLTKVKVLSTVEEVSKAEKVLIFKKRRRKHYRNLKGFRASYTLLKIEDVLVA
eukprot:TRINITY_DN1083_c0_g1_i2.p1 TRINITY_DN1083_c0_g1~~TRINITY_DN1083_c0_g1_i2.p1  ORF type:complete len:171 (-),score=31.57 TRINITY_DN1083_c0_g1_i2:81-593(-)